MKLGFLLRQFDDEQLYSLYRPLVSYAANDPLIALDATVEFFAFFTHSIPETGAAAGRGTAIKFDGGTEELFNARGLEFLELSFVGSVSMMAGSRWPRQKTGRKGFSSRHLGAPGHLANLIEATQRHRLHPQLGTKPMIELCMTMF